MQIDVGLGQLLLPFTHPLRADSRLSQRQDHWMSHSHCRRLVVRIEHAGVRLVQHQSANSI